MLTPVYAQNKKGKSNVIVLEEPENEKAFAEPFHIYEKNETFEEVYNKFTQNQTVVKSAGFFNSIKNGVRSLLDYFSAIKNILNLQSDKKNQ